MSIFSFTFPLLFQCLLFSSTILLTATAMATLHSQQAHTDPGELRAVYDLMTATGNGWVTSIPDVCKSRWHGIECVQDQDNVLHVVSLSFGVLSDDTAFPICDPNSSISPSVVDLSHLKKLFFYQCCRDNPQPIPPEIGRLGATLEFLVLRENGHIGSIPTELSNLTKLHTLDLHGNSLNDSIPSSLSNLSSLLLLDLSKNQIQGEIPKSFGGLKTLNILDLNSNSIEGPILHELGGLIHLKKLDLSNNQLIGTIPASLGELTRLLLLDFGGNYLFGGIPTEIGQMSSLQTLILQKTRLNAPIPPSLGNLSSLQVLVLSSSHLIGPIPESLGQLSNLRVLYLDKNKLNGSIPDSLGKLSRINEFNLDGNLLSGPLPFSREFVWRLGKRLTVTDNPNLCYGFLRSATDAFPLFPEGTSVLGIKFCRSNFTVPPSTPKSFHSHGAAYVGHPTPSSSFEDGNHLSLLFYVLVITLHFLVD